MSLPFKRQSPDADGIPRVRAKFPLLNMSVGPLCIPSPAMEYIEEVETDFPREIVKMNIFGVVLCLLQPFCCNEIMIIDLFLVALLSLLFAFAY